MSPFQAIMFVLVAIGGTATVLTRNPKKQAIVLSFFGLLQTILFVALRAPDVALSAIAVGAAALPLMLLVVLANVARLRKKE